jgi:hypothetical protein
MQIKEVSKIVPGLVKLVLEETESEGGQVITTEVHNYEELALKLKQVILNGNNLKMEFTFGENPGEKSNPQQSESKVKKIKSSFSD